MKKIYRLSLLIMLLLLSVILTSCDSKKDLYILNWDEYINEDLIDEFEKKYDCNVILDIAQSNETMFSKIMTDAAPYDIAFPSDYMISQMVAYDVVKEIDYSRLQNFSYDAFDSSLMNLIARDCPALINNSEGETNGYVVPYFWGTLGIMYNTDNLSLEQIEIIQEKEWAVLFEPNLLGNVKVGMYASARDSIASALLYNNLSLNTRSAEDLSKAEAALSRMNYQAWATDELKTSVASGKYDVALVYSGDYFDTLYSLYEESDDPHISFDMIAPKNNNVFFDGMVMPKNSMNEDLAYKFIDFMLDYDNALTNAEYVGYCPTQTAVYQTMLNDEDFSGITDLPVYYPGPSAESGGEIYQYLDEKTYELYDKIYKKVKK